MARIKPQALLQQSKKKKVPNRISLTTIAFFSLIILLVLFCVFSTFRYFSSRSVNYRDQGISIGRKGLGNLKNPGLPRYVIIKTSKGTITVELFKDKAPETVYEFINLCERGHFKGMQFHRVIRNVVLQVGDAHSLESAVDWTSRGKQSIDVGKSAKHEPFMLGASKKKHETEGFELYITTAPIPDQKENLIVFGQIVKGIEVVQEIEEVDTDEHYQPKSPISVIDMTLDSIHSNA